MLVRPKALLGGALAAFLTVAPAAIVAAPAFADDEAACSTLDDPVYSRVRPDSQTQLVTPWRREADRAAVRYGYSEDQGMLFRATLDMDSDKDGVLKPVHRLANYRARDFRYSIDSTEIAAAVADGYVDQGPRLLASDTPAACFVAIKQYVKDGKHRLASTALAQEALVREGWAYDRAAFYARPAPTPSEPGETDDDKIFSFAVMPDTQQEVRRANDSRFVNRTAWLAGQESTLDLRWVTHSGDVVNWDTPDHSQYEVASRAMRPLEDADIPYSLALGNHDTAAVCPGGSACDPLRTRKLFRDTTTFNRYFTAARFGLEGQFEAGKVDNGYTTYSAGGLKWMVLTLEMWPRPAVVAWAKQVVGTHPDHNVVVVTHDYLDDLGGLGQGADYGDTPPQELYDELISQYANIRMVFSGHTGTTATRVDTGVHGNKIYSFLQTIHSSTTNPVRLVEVDAEKGAIKTWVYSPYTRQSYPEWNSTIEDVNWVR